VSGREGAARGGGLPSWLRAPLYFACKHASLALLTLLYRLRAHGKENIPRGGALLVANHQSLMDPPILGVHVPGQYHPLARRTLFDVPLLGPLISNLNAIPVSQDGTPDRRAIQTCIERLRAGGVVAIYPEGSRTWDGEIHPFATGAALIARRGGKPIVPAAILGAFEAWPRTSRLPRAWGRVRVVYGEPIPPERFAGLRSEEATALIEAEVRRLFERERARGAHAPTAGAEGTAGGRYPAGPIPGP